MKNEVVENQEANMADKSGENFIEFYNQNIPASFTQATAKSLAAFKDQYPSLFKDNDMWVVNKHRKKFMDWLSTH